jgi:signal transduction histidine kinase
MSRLRTRLSITSLFTGATLVPLVIVGVLLLYLAVRTTHQISDSLGEKIMKQATRRVQDSVRNYLHHAERASDVFSDLVLTRVLPGKNPDSWRIAMLAQLRTTPEVAAIGFADASDDYVYLMRFPPELEYGSGEGSAAGTMMIAHEAYLDGHLGKMARPSVSFKVRERPWYQSAMAVQGPTWTPAYTWFTADVRPPNPEFSVAYTRALHDPKTGSFIGVLAVDTLLTQVNTTLHELSQPLNAFLVITDDAGVLIGSSDLGPGVTTLPSGRRLQEIANPVARAVSAEIAANGTKGLRSPVPRHLSVNGQTYWANQSKLSLGPGTDWFVTIAIPEGSILTEAQQSIHWILTIGSAYLSFAVIASVMLARVLTRPMRRLAAFAREIGKGNFDERIDVATTSELAELSESLNGMAVSLRERVQLAAQRDAAEQATAAKSRLIAHVSHEFRTPLNAIVNYAELLRDSAEIDKCLSDAADATNILTASRHLLSLVENLLDLSTIEAGRLHLEICAFSIAGLVDEVAATSRPIVEVNRNRQHVVLPTPADVQMTSDPMRVRQILINLVANAGKYTQDGDVTIRAEVDHAPRVVRFIVCDTGPGIPPDKLERLFEPFIHIGGAVATRAAAGGRAGSGLGLAISGQLTRSLGGDIDVKTGPAGTQMTVTLPLDAPIHHESPAIV